MKLNVESSAVQEAIKVLARLAPPLTGNVTVSVDNNKFYLISSSDLARCKVLVPGEVSGTSNFGIPLEALRDSTRGRTNLEMTYDKSLLVVKSGKYQAKLSTVDVVQTDDSNDDSEFSTWKISSDQAQWLKKAVSHVALKPNSVSSVFMPLSIKLTSKGAFVSCYDNNHMAFTRDKETVGDLDVTLPLDTVTGILDVMNSASFTMKVSKAVLQIKNKLVDASLSLPASESDDVIAVSAVMDKAKEAVSAKGASVEVSKQDVLAFLDNAKSVATKERAELKIAGDTGKVSLEVVTTGGEAKATIKAKVDKKFKANIDLEYFQEAIGKGGENLVLKIVDSSFLLLEASNSYAVIALNQD